MTTSSDVLINQRYRLEAIIGQGGMGIVYRAVDRLNGTHVALKRVMLQPQRKSSYPGLSSSDSLRLTISQEFRVLASLRHPHIISVLDYGFDGQREPFFTMELLEDPFTIFQTAQNLSFAKKCGLFVQMLQALAYLHRRSVIHRDLKPDNVLVVAEKVKLLDFGLAVEGRREEKPSEELSGTLLYMAPEVLQGDRASTASDIYAAGLIAYEMFVGRHPFIASDSKYAITTIDTMISGRVDPTDLPDVPELRNAVMQMVEHDPADRVKDLNTVIDTLRQFLEDKDPIEAISIRESFLQSASFVGRERERQQLGAALDRAGERHGSIWLIGGESGVGKSRLIDELQTQALVNGVLVLRGQSVAEGSAPYQVWRPILRRLVLQTALDPLEAGILSALVPDIERLLGSPIVLPPELDGPIAQQRLLNLIEAVFRSQNQPMLVLLEDLQWAGEGLIILKHYLNIVADMPLLIVGTYRDNEYPTMPTEMAGAQLLLLQRFDPNTINQLTRAMLGDANYSSGISSLLQQETEGNALFMIEVMRALADESGGLARIGMTTLPHRVLSGGIQAILLRRLERVPTAAQPLLQLAAAAGRELDLRLLSSLFPMVDLDLWLLQVATVVEVQENRYRFAHDKLREAILSQVKSAALSQLHERIARGMETLYAAEPTHFMALAYQWEKANEEQPPNAERLRQTVFYLEKAAALLFSQNAFVQSKAIYERLFKWYTQYKTLVPAGVAAEQEAAWYGILATTDTILSNQESAIANAGKALALYGVNIPKSPLGLTGALLGETVKQILHRLMPKRFLNSATGQQRERLLAIAPVFNTYSAANFALARQLPGLYGSLRSVNTHEYTGLTDRLAGDYALMVNLTGALGMNRIAERYYSRVRTLSAAYPNESPYALFLTGVYYASTASRPRAEADVTEAADNYERTKNWVGWCLSQITLASIYSIKGDFSQSYDLFARVQQVAVNNQIPSAELMTLYSLARIETLRGDLATAMQRLDKAITLITSGIEPSIEISAWAYRAQALWQLNAIDESLQIVNHAVKRSEVLKVSPNFASIAFITLIEVLLEALETPAILPSNTNPLALSEKLIGLLKRLNRLPANADKSGIYRIQARQAWINGKTANAERLIQKALDVATKLGTAYEIALAHYELGRHLPATDPTRKMHLESARAAFTAFGFPHDTALAADALIDTA